MKTHIPIVPWPPLKSEVASSLAVELRVDRHTVDQAVCELHKFFQLAAGADRPLAMPCPFDDPRPPLVDVVWHRFVEHADEYRDWCFEHFGFEFKHDERDIGPAGLHWIENYEAAWGSLSDLWFRDASGGLDRNAYDRYLNRSDIEASWRCTPKIRMSWKCNPLRAYA